MLFTKRSTITPPPHIENNGRSAAFFKQFKLTNRFRKKAPRFPASRGATPVKIWKTVVPKKFGRAARPETEHNISGGHPRAPSPRQKTTPVQSFFQYIKLGRLFPQIVGQSKGTTTDKSKSSVRARGRRRTKGKRILHTCLLDGGGRPTFSPRFQGKA